MRQPVSKKLRGLLVMRSVQKNSFKGQMFPFEVLITA